MEAAKKYADDYDGMQWEKDRVEIAFIKGAEFTNQQKDQRRYGEFNELQKRLNEKDKEIDFHIANAYKMKGEIIKLVEEIASLKEALRIWETADNRHDLPFSVLTEEEGDKIKELLK